MLNVVVVGNGMVGHHYIEQLVASSVQAKITVIGGETRPAYDRVHLSEYFAGRTPEELALTPESIMSRLVLMRTLVTRLCRSIATIKL